MDENTGPVPSDQIDEVIARARAVLDDAREALLPGANAPPTNATVQPTLGRTPRTRGTGQPTNANSRPMSAIALRTLPQS